MRKDRECREDLTPVDRNRHSQKNGNDNQNPKEDYQGTFGLVGFLIRHKRKNGSVK